MNYKVNISSSAEDDLFEICKYLYFYDSEKAADDIYLKLREKCFSLKKHPNRGHIPKELSLFEIHDFLEIIDKPFRIIYQIIGKEIFVHSVLDGRRDMQKLLQERLIRS